MFVKGKIFEKIKMELTQTLFKNPKISSIWNQALNFVKSFSVCSNIKYLFVISESLRKISMALRSYMIMQFSGEFDYAFMFGRLK